jgi:hypothetical protein
MSTGERRRPVLRTVAALAIGAGTLVATATPVAAQTSPCSEPDPPRWCENYEIGDPDTGPSDSPGPRVVSTTPTYAHYVVRWRLIDGEACERIEVSEWSDQPPGPDATLAAAREELQRRLDTPVVYYHAQTVVDRVACEGPEVEVDVRGLAIAAWAALNPPTFDAQIAPGRALTGMPAYLELAGTTEATEVVPLPDGLGELRIEAAVVEHVVDFGDGSAPVVTTSLGAPWNGDPSQQIAHTYQDTGARTVTVDTRWGARFVAPGLTEDLEPRVETASLDLQVNQVQAVRVLR